MTTNGDTNRIWTIGGEAVRGLGSYHKSLPHNEFGEVDAAAFAAFVAATRGDGRGFAHVPQGNARIVCEKDNAAGMDRSAQSAAQRARPTQEDESGGGNSDDDVEDDDPFDPTKCKVHPAAQFTNPQAGLSTDQLTAPPSAFSMPPAPRVMSHTTAAEMVELYWMALLRDQDLCGENPGSGSFTFDQAAAEIEMCFRKALETDGPGDRFQLGVDVPGRSDKFCGFDAKTVFRLGLPGDEFGPMISQFFVRPVAFGTQRIDQRQRPYKAGRNYLVKFGDWLKAQSSGRDRHGQAYSKANEHDASQYENHERYICTMRDLARFVNKDALHQAYFNAALILLSGGGLWPRGNPYFDFNVDPDSIVDDIEKGPLADREAGFGVLGGPHILALVSEVATRALKIVWQQKWQQHLRLRPEAYGGLVHVQEMGALKDGVQTKRAYGLPSWLPGTDAAQAVKNMKGTYLLPMAFSPGSPTHPAYGAGHATVAGACVTVLKAFFHTYTTKADGTDDVVKFTTLKERGEPFGKPTPISCWCPHLPSTAAATGRGRGTDGGPKIENNRKPLKFDQADLTIEGELNKLAQNVAMGRSMGGVHWRTDNTRSLVLGEAIAAGFLADITTDANERPSFTFRTFARKDDGNPKRVVIEGGRIYVDGIEKSRPASAL